MGAELKGVPLSLDLVKCLKCASEAEYCLEITGFKRSDETPEEIEEIYSIESLKADIQKYEGLLKTLRSNIRDKGEKLELKLKQLHKKLGELQTQQVTNHADHEQGKGSAFRDDVRDFKELLNNSNTERVMTKGSKVGSVCPGQRGKTTTLLPSSSVYTNFQDSSVGYAMDTEDSRLQTRMECSIASDGVSPKGHQTLSTLQKNRGSSFKRLGPRFAKGLEKVTTFESASSRKSRFSQEFHKQNGFLGASLDTAMELSDDEEKKNSKDCKWKDVSHHPYTLRSYASRREGFKVIYPSGDPEAVEVQQTDMKHLDPYEFLNDTVIDFYIKYLQRPEFLSQQKKADFHFFNTFFYKKLLLEKKKRKKASAYHSKLRKWTKGINIFEKKYLLVPVHDSAHWSLGIICLAKGHRGRGLTPYILHLDSMKEGHVSEEVFTILRRYLEAEWNHIRGLEEFDTAVLNNFICKRVEVPLQQNAWDCGLFLLYFIECFLRDADGAIEPNLLDSMFGSQWFKPYEASNLRKRIRSILENLVEESSDEIVMENMD